MGTIGKPKLNPMQFAPKACDRHMRKYGKPQLNCRRCDDANASTRSTARELTGAFQMPNLLDQNMGAEERQRAEQALQRLTVDTEHVVIDPELTADNTFGAARPDLYRRSTLSAFSNTSNTTMQETHYDTALDPHKRRSQYKMVQKPVFPMERRESFGREIEFDGGGAMLSTGVPSHLYKNGYTTSHEVLDADDNLVYKSEIVTGQSYLSGSSVQKKRFSGTLPAFVPAAFDTPLTSFNPSQEQLRPSIADARALLGLGDDDPEVRKRSAVHTGKRAQEAALHLANQQAIGRHTTAIQDDIRALPELRATIQRREDRLDGYLDERDEYEEGERLPRGLVRNIDNTTRDLREAREELQNTQQAITTNQGRLRALGVPEDQIPVEAPQPTRRSQTN